MYPYGAAVPGANFAIPGYYYPPNAVNGSQAHWIPPNGPDGAPLPPMTYEEAMRAVTADPMAWQDPRVGR